MESKDCNCIFLCAIALVCMVETFERMYRAFWKFWNHDPEHGEVP